MAQDSTAKLLLLLVIPISATRVRVYFTTAYFHYLLFLFLYRIYNFFVKNMLDTFANNQNINKNLKHCNGLLLDINSWFLWRVRFAEIDKWSHGKAITARFKSINVSVFSFINFPFGLSKLKIQREIAMSNKLKMLITGREIICWKYQGNTFTLVMDKNCVNSESVLLFVMNIKYGLTPPPLECNGEIWQHRDYGYGPS